MKQLFFATLSVGLFVSIGGCDRSTPTPSPNTSTDSHDDHGHDHHDHDEHDHNQSEAAPASFKEAVAEISELSKAIEAAFSAGDLHAADGPVHEVGHHLEALPALAEKAGLSGDPLASVNTAQATLFEAFGVLDQTIHGKSDGKAWVDVDKSIADAIASLQSLANETKQENP